MKRILFILAHLCVWQPSFAATLEWVPQGRPFRLAFADPREVRTAILIAGQENIQASVGDYFSILSIEDAIWERHEIFFGLEGAGYFSLRQAGGRFPLEHTDGLLGVYLEGRRDQLQWQFRYTHISSHLSDGSSGTPIAFSREHLSLRFGVTPLPEMFLYGGARALVNTIPEVPPWGFQVGGYYFLKSPQGRISPFVGCDVQWREESAYNPSLSVQLGIALNDPMLAYRSFRLFYAYYTGSDPRGQYFRNSLTTHSLGIEMHI